MINTEYYRGKKVAVVGIARSGLACANLLIDLGASVWVTDIQNNKDTKANAGKLKKKNISIELGRHSLKFIKGKDLVIISPGIPAKAKPLVWAEQYGIPVIGEIEFAWSLCEGTCLAVTGSNGKTTVTTLIGKILEADKRKSFVCGNIGNPFSAEVYKIKKNDFVSLEISSFQLERIKAFKPKIAVILNLSRNHLDRHKDMQEYLSAKKRIFMNQDSSDYLVLNYQDPVISALSAESKSRVVFFNRKKGVNPNHSVVSAVGRILGISEGVVKRVLKGFLGVEHRMENVAEINNVRFINDSKATTAESAIWALNNINGPVIMIAGGRHKGIDYSVILDAARKKVKKLILIGEARQIIKKDLKGAFPVEEALTLEKAVKIAFLSASPRDCVLLSPMCSSFDMFKDYEDRGRAFKEAVHRLEKVKV